MKIVGRNQENHPAERQLLRSFAVANSVNHFANFYATQRHNTVFKMVLLERIMSLLDVKHSRNFLH
jgi:hypothetical protein